MSNILKGLNEGRNYGRDSWDSNMPGYQGDYGGAKNFGRRNREWDEDDRIDARIRAEYEKKKEYERTGTFWLKLKDSQRHLPAGPFTGKQAANTAAIELLKQQPELKGNLLITAYGPDEQLDELSNNTLSSYKKKAGADATQADKRGDYVRGNKRMSGIIKATKKEFANDEKKVPEGKYDSGDYYNARQGREYGAKSSQVDSGAYEFEKEVHRNEPGGDHGRPKNLKGVSKSLPADAFGRTTGKIPAGKTGRIHSMMNDVDEDLDENLHKWFKEKWVRFGPDGKIRGDCARGDDSEGKPKCLPQSKAHSLGKKGRASAASRKRREDPNPERSGKAINVNTKKKSNESVSEGSLNETRNSLFAFVKQQFPTWPDYVLKDFLYQQAKGIRDQAELDDFLKRNKQDFGNCKWTLTKLPITFDIFTPKTQRMLASREGGSSNPFQVPRDAERHAQQSQMIQQKGVSAEPIIVAKLSNGYDLIEGWHRTIQHLKAFPQGYTGPAWVCTGATYKSESVEQGVVEGELEEACWKGYHKEGNKKMFGKIYPNCVKNTNEEQEQLDEKCWDTHKQVGMKSKGGKQVPNCVPKESVEESHHSETCPHCGGEMVSEELMNEKKDACYYKVKSRYKVWPSAYASGALVKCRKKGASNWGNGGKSNESIEEGWKEEAQELEDWSKEVNMRLYRAHESQRLGLARQLSKLEQKHFGSEFTHPNLTNIVWSALRALQKGDMVHYDPERVGQMPFGNIVGDDAKIIAQYNITREELAGYRMLHDKGMVDNLEQFLKLRRLVRAKSWPLEYFEELEKLTPEEAWLKMANDLNWSKDNMSEEVQSKTDDKLLAYYAQRKAEKQKQQSQPQDQLDEKWTKKYKDSINCSNPKGFSQKAHCAGKQKNESAIMKGLKL